MQEKDRRERGDHQAEEADKTGKPSIPRDAVEDLEPPEEKADAVKGGLARPHKDLT